MRKTFSLINSTWTATGPNDPWPYYDYLVNDENSMIAQVTLTPFTVGFSGFEQAVSTGIAFAAIKNQAGKVVTPSTESATVNFPLNHSAVYFHEFVSNSRI
jgi:ABC-type phosphate transport system substrate-binding protein